MTDAGCLATSGFYQHPAIGDHTKIPTTDETVAPLIQKQPMTSMTPPESSEDGDKTEPSSAQDGLGPTSFPAHVPALATAAAADPSSTPASSFNPHPEATASGGAPSLHQPISVTSLIEDTLHLPQPILRLFGAAGREGSWSTLRRTTQRWCPSSQPCSSSWAELPLTRASPLALAVRFSSPCRLSEPSLSQSASGSGTNWILPAPSSQCRHSQAVGVPSRMPMVTDEVGLEEHHIV